MATHTTIRDNARQLYLSRPKTVTAVAVAQHLGVSIQWLSLFSRGKIANPGVNTIEELTAYLTEEKAKANV